MGFFLISVLQSAHALDTANLAMNVGKRTRIIFCDPLRLSIGLSLLKLKTNLTNTAHH